MLSSIIQNEAVIKNSFVFVNGLKSLSKCNSDYKMVSFDISSLYTKIPLDETIQIILNHVYNDEKPSTAIKKRDMEKLLKIATKDSHFLFNGKLYDRIDGVSMGSPLAPLLAEIFLQEFEKKHLPEFKDMGIKFWKRYVDDTFVLLDSNVDTKEICAKLSQCHPCLKFTYEEEDPHTCSLPFLDVFIQRKPNRGFETRIYRKPTFSGLMTKWRSFVPKQYKYNAVSSMVYRAMKICSTHQLLQ
jgi:hypothetical protein